MEFISEIFNLILQIASDWGYWGIFALMAVESSFVPFPSEIVIPPAAYLAFQGEFNIFLVIIAGIIGSLVGASINYWLARSLGRVIIYPLIDKKWAKIFLLSREKMEKAEQYFLNYGNSSTFIGRLVPAIRQLISLPAGFTRMDYKKFIWYTFLGSGLWVSVLAVLGYWVGANQELLKEYYHLVSFAGILLAVVFVLSIVYNKKAKIKE